MLFSAFRKNWHVFPFYYRENQKPLHMKQAFDRLVKKETTREKFHMMSTIMMILLFLTFWGVSFYVLVNSLA